MEKLQSILFKNEFTQSLIGVPPSSLQPDLRPFQPAFPLELIHYILYLAALRSKRKLNPQYALLEISRSIRRHLFPVFFETLEIVGMKRMVSFASVFAPPSDHDGNSGGTAIRSRHLISSAVKRLALIDNSPGDIQSPDLIIPPDLLTTILSLCTNVRTLFLNYIRPIPEIDSFLPAELTVRRGLRYVDLRHHPFKHITRLHCRYEQLFPYLLFSHLEGKLRTPLLTHLCFTHHLDCDQSVCVEIVQGCLGQSPSSSTEPDSDGRFSVTNNSSSRSSFPNLSVLIVEIAIQKWDVRTDPPLRAALANIPDARNQLFVRVSPYNTALPVDGLIGPTGLFASTGIQGGSDGSSHPSYFARDVWDVTDCLDWRTHVWTKEYIEEIMAPW